MSKKIINPDTQADSSPQPDVPVALTQAPSGYADWLAELKTRIHTAQQRAALAVNRELVLLYWQIGRDILVRQAQQGWGAKVIERLAHDLRTAFSQMKGFSPRNLKYMRTFAEAWPDTEFAQQAAAQLPWFHLCTLIDKLKTHEARDWYISKAVEHNWSRNILVMQIETQARERSGKAVTNFVMQLPKPQSDLARESHKDPSRFDFLGLTDEAEEREIESALVQHISRFLLELGAGFAYVGRQVHIEVGGDDFFIDLLFYHLKLRCYVVVELKAGAFKPEHTGQLNFYLSAVDLQVKSKHDNPTIGLLLCKTQNRVVAEYSLRDTNKRWLAQVGYERVKEIENPELASARARDLYQTKCYPQAWIEKRLCSITICGELTDEWKARGVQEGNMSHFAGISSCWIPAFAGMTEYLS